MFTNVNSQYTYSRHCAKINNILLIDCCFVEKWPCNCVWTHVWTTCMQTHKMIRILFKYQLHMWQRASLATSTAWAMPSCRLTSPSKIERPDWWMSVTSSTIWTRSRLLDSTSSATCCTSQTRTVTSCTEETRTWVNGPNTRWAPDKWKVSGSRLLGNWRWCTTGKAQIRMNPFSSFISLVMWAQWITQDRPTLPPTCNCGFCAQCRISNRWSWILMLMIIGLLFCTSDITQLVCGMPAHLSSQGAFVYFVVHTVCFVVHTVCFVVHTVCFVVHIVCQVDVTA